MSNDNRFLSTYVRGGRTLTTSEIVTAPTPGTDIFQPSSVRPEQAAGGSTQTWVLLCGARSSVGILFFLLEMNLLTKSLLWHDRRAGEAVAHFLGGRGQGQSPWYSMCLLASWGLLPCLETKPDCQENSLTDDS